MGSVIRFPRGHARTSSRTKRKSSAVTLPPVAREIFSATSREGQPLPSQSDVTQPADTPISRAKSPRLIELESKYSASFMERSFSLTKTSAQEKILVSLYGPDRESAQNSLMIIAKPKRSKMKKKQREYKFAPAYVRSWRQFRGMTLEELAPQAGMSIGNLSNIESGAQGYTQKNLEALAAVLECQPADLIAGSPGNAENMLMLWEKATESEREQLIKIATALISGVEKRKAG